MFQLASGGNLRRNRAPDAPADVVGHELVDVAREQRGDDGQAAERDGDEVHGVEARRVRRLDGSGHGALDRGADPGHGVHGGGRAVRDRLEDERHGALGQAGAQRGRRDLAGDVGGEALLEDRYVDADCPWVSVFAVVRVVRGTHWILCPPCSSPSQGSRWRDQGLQAS